MSDFGSFDSLDWVVVSYADMMSISCVEPPRTLKDVFGLYNKNSQMGSEEVVASGSNGTAIGPVASGSNAVPSGSAQVIENKVVTTMEPVRVETNGNVKVTKETRTVIAKVASETISIMTQLNSIHTRHNETVQSTMARPGEKVKMISNQESLEIDEWEVVPDRYLLGVTRSVIDSFVRARTAKIQALDRDINEMAEKFNNIDILSMNWIKKHAVNLLPSQTESPMSHCPSCNHALAKKKPNHCKICRTVICPKCSQFVDYKATRQALCPDAVHTLQSKFQKKYYDMLRLCENCERLIELKKIRQERHMVTYPLVEKHQALRDMIEQSRPIVAIFQKINQSLMNGETQYRLSDAITMSRRIDKLAVEIDRQAQDIAEAPAEPGSRQAALLVAVKKAAFIYVKDNLSHLRLPTQAQVEEARQRHFEKYSSRLRIKNKRLVEPKMNS